MKLFNREKTIQSDKKIIERARDLQNNLEAKRNRIGKGKYGRVLKMARKPTNDEFNKTSKITGARNDTNRWSRFPNFLILQL